MLSLGGIFSSPYRPLVSGEGLACHHLLTVKNSGRSSQLPWGLVPPVCTFNATPLLPLSGNCFCVCVPIVLCSLNVCPHAQKELYSTQDWVWTYHSLALHNTQLEEGWQ